LFHARPPRDEDMELILRLKEEIANKDRIIKEAEEQMEFFKNELINREELYNKYFGNSHKVGYINPIKANKENNLLTSKTNTNLQPIVKVKYIYFIIFF
jgi:hypothetical protein